MPETRLTMLLRSWCSNHVTVGSGAVSRSARLGDSLPAPSSHHQQAQDAATEQQQASGLGNGRNGQNIQRQVLPGRKRPPRAVAEGQEVTTLRESGRRCRPGEELGAEKVKSAGRT